MAILSLAAFARTTHRTKRDVELLLELGLPHETHGQGRGSTTRIDGEAALRWLAARALDPPATVPEGMSLDQARTALALAQTRLAEYRLKQLEGDLLSVTAFEPIIARAVAAARAKLLAVPSKLAPVVAPADPHRARQLLERAMLEVLGELQTMLDTMTPPPAPWEPPAEAEPAA